PSQLAHIEHFVETKERERPACVSEAEIERILVEMQSEDEGTRAKAVREICPCRMPWDVFARLRKAAKRLQNDPSPLVAANARHIEEDARTVASFEAQLEWAREREDEQAYQQGKRGKEKRRTK